MKLCRLFGVSADDLLDDTKELPQPLPEKHLSSHARALIQRLGPAACYYLALRCVLGLLLVGFIVWSNVQTLAIVAPITGFPPQAFLIPIVAVPGTLLLLGRMIFYLCLGHKLRKKGL